MRESTTSAGDYTVSFRYPIECWTDYLTVFCCQPPWGRQSCEDTEAQWRRKHQILFSWHGRIWFPLWPDWLLPAQPIEVYRVWTGSNWPCSPGNPLFLWWKIVITLHYCSLMIIPTNRKLMMLGLSLTALCKDQSSLVGITPNWVDSRLRWCWIRFKWMVPMWCGLQTAQNTIPYHFGKLVVTGGHTSTSEVVALLHFMLWLSWLVFL